jgi:hypothetical protein
MTVNPNPNEPNYPYGGGSDNPGDNTALPGGPSNVAAVETGTPLTHVLHPAIPLVLAQGGSDTQLGGLQAVPPSGAAFEAPDDTELDTDTGGPTVDPVTGNVRVPGQDETTGETETTSGEAPVAFPEPTP